MSEVVNAFYRNVLGREADQGGLQYWVEQLNSGKPIGDVLSTIVGATTDGRVVMTNQGPLAYDDAGQLVNRYGEVMVLDSSGNWAPAPRDVPVGMVSDGAGGFTPDPNFTTDIFGNSVTQPYDTSTDYSSLSPVVDGYTSAYSAPPPASTEEKSTNVEIVGSQPA